MPQPLLDHKDLAGTGDDRWGAADPGEGELITEGKLRKSVIDMASKGSSPAQALLDKWIEDDKLEEVLW